MVRPLVRVKGQFKLGFYVPGALVGVLLAGQMGNPSPPARARHRTTNSTPHPKHQQRNTRFEPALLVPTVGPHEQNTTFKVGFCDPGLGPPDQYPTSQVGYWDHKVLRKKFR